MSRPVLKYVAVAAVVVPILVAGAASPASASSTVKVNCAHQSLQAAINKAHAGGTVAVKGHCVGRFTIGKNLTVKGNPAATLDAAHKGSVITVKGKRRITLASLTITNGTAPAGGGIDLTGKGTLTLKKVTVTHNTSTGGSGGGVSATKGAVLHITHSKVLANTSSVPATSSNLIARGGGIAATGKTTISDSTLAGNVAHGSGTVGSSGFGGAVYATGALIIEGSKLSKNVAESNAREANVASGGAVAWLPTGANGLAIKGSNLSSNQATVQDAGSAAASGGALYIAPAGGAHGKAKIGTSTFTSNKVTATSSASGVSARGGAVDATGLRAALAIATSSFHGNQVSGSATLGGVTIVGGAVATGGKGGVGLDRSTFDSDQLQIQAAGAGASAYGGGLYLGGTGTDEVINSTITKDSVTASGLTSTLELGGGGIAAFDKILRVRFSTITSNQAVSDSPGGGGGIYVASISSTRLDGSILTANNAVQGSQCVGSVATGGYNVHSDSSGCEWPSHVGDKLVTSADLGTLGAHGGPTHTIPLKSGSPALNIASKAHCDGLKVDQRGVKRPQKTKCDAGAYELKA